MPEFGPRARVVPQRWSGSCTDVMGDKRGTSGANVLGALNPGIHSKRRSTNASVGGEFVFVSPEAAAVHRFPPSGWRCARCRRFKRDRMLRPAPGRQIRMRYVEPAEAARGLDRGGPKTVAATNARRAEDMLRRRRIPERELRSLGNSIVGVDCGWACSTEVSTRFKVGPHPFLGVAARSTRASAATGVWDGEGTGLLRFRALRGLRWTLPRRGGRRRGKRLRSGFFAENGRSGGRWKSEHSFQFPFPGAGGRERCERSRREGVAAGRRCHRGNCWRRVGVLPSFGGGRLSELLVCLRGSALPAPLPGGLERGQNQGPDHHGHRDQGLPPRGKKEWTHGRNDFGEAIRADGGSLAMFSLMEVSAWRFFIR